MTPLEFHKTVQELLQWDADRIATLLTGLVFGGVPVWWFLRRKKTARPSADDGVQRTDRDLDALRAKVRGLTEDKQRLEQENQSLKEEVARLKREAEAIELDQIEEGLEETHSPLDDFPNNEVAGKAKKKRAYLIGDGVRPHCVDRLVKIHNFKRKAIYVYYLATGRRTKADSRNIEQQIATYRRVGHEVAHPEITFEDVPFWIHHGRAEAVRLGLDVGR